MPLYEYHCDACGSRFEKIRKFSDPPLEVCDKCGKGPITKLLSSPAIQFKGTGWYITDYAKKSSPDSSGGKSSSSSDSSSESKSDAKKSDASSSSSSTSSSTSSSDKKSDKKSDKND
jgi:putative FmdB family regulatory protein